MQEWNLSLLLPIANHNLCKAIAIVAALLAVTIAMFVSYSLCPKAICSLIWEQSDVNLTGVGNCSLEIPSHHHGDEASSTIGPNNLPVLTRLFVGRDKDVENITDILLGKRQSWIKVVSVYGLPAAGKSTLAIHIGYEMANRGIAVRYINMNDAYHAFQENRSPETQTASNSRSKSASYRETAELTKRHSSIQIPMYSHEERRYRKLSPLTLLEWAKSVENKTLLILDNCDELLFNGMHVDYQFKELLQALSQASISLHILTTTRQKISVIHGLSYRLTNLSDKAAVDLLKQKSISTLTQEQAVTIAELVGNIPLALHVVGSLINDNVPVDIVITELNERLLDTLSSETLPPSQRVRKVMELSYKHLNATIQDFACFLTTFPGSFSVDAAIRVLDIFIDYPVFLIFHQVIINNPRQCLKRLEEASLLEHYWHADQSRYQLHKLIKELFISQPLCVEKGQIYYDYREYSRAVYYAELLLEVVERHASDPGNNEKNKDIIERDRHNFEIFVSRHSYMSGECSIGLKEEFNYYWTHATVAKIFAAITTPGDLLLVLFTKTEINNMLIRSVCASFNQGDAKLSWKLLGMMFNTECFRVCQAISHSLPVETNHRLTFSLTICFLDCISIHAWWLMNLLIGICYTLVIVIVPCFRSPCDLGLKSVARKVAVLWTLIVSNPWFWSSLDLTGYTYKTFHQSLSLHILFVSAIDNLCIISIALLLHPSHGFEYRVFKVLSSNLVFIHFSLCVLLTTSFVNINFYNTITSFCALVVVTVLIRGDIDTAYYILRFFIVVVVCFVCIELWCVSGGA